MPRTDATEHIDVTFELVEFFMEFAALPSDGLEFDTAAALLSVDW